jgi:hypothetical protein
MVHFVNCLFNFYRVLSRSKLLSNFLNWGESDTLPLSTSTLGIYAEVNIPPSGTVL